MRTLDEQTTRSFSRWARLSRDARLLWRVVGMVGSYFTTGAKIRKRYREKQRSGDIYYVDEP